MRLTKRESILLIIVLVLGISFLFVYFVYQPLKDEIKELDKEYNELVEEETKAKLLSIKTDLLKKELKDIVDNTAEAYEGMLEIWDQADILVYLEKMMKDLCDKHTINSYTPMNISNISSAEISLSITTNYDNLQKILSNLEDGEHYCTLESLSIKVKSRIETNVDWPPMDLNVDMTIRFYTSNQDIDYPEDYNFMKGSYNKENIFLED